MAHPSRSRNRNGKGGPASVAAPPDPLLVAADPTTAPPPGRRRHMAVVVALVLVAGAGVYWFTWNDPPAIVRVAEFRTAATQTAIDPGGTFLLTVGSSDVTTWSLPGRKAVPPVLKREYTTDFLALSPDGKTLALDGYPADEEGESYSVDLWGTAVRQPVGGPLLTASLDDEDAVIHFESADAGAISPDGRTLAVGSSSGVLSFWDLMTDSRIGDPIVVHEDDGIEAIAFSPDGRTLATGGFHDVIILWDVASRSRIGDPLQDSTMVNSVSFSADGKLLATGNLDGVGRLWDVATRERVGSPLADAYSVRFHPTDAKILATAGRHGKPQAWRLWNTKTWKSVSTPSPGPAPPCRSPPTARPWPSAATSTPRSGASRASLTNSPPDRPGAVPANATARSRNTGAYLTEGSPSGALPSTRSHGATGPSETRAQIPATTPPASGLSFTANSSTPVWPGLICAGSIWKPGVSTVGGKTAREPVPWTASSSRAAGWRTACPRAGSRRRCRSPCSGARPRVLRGPWSR
ncbi:hypothetical protein ACFQYP_15420 [Nonomuraea antimicrobica]